MERKGELGERTHRWIQEIADRDFGGDWSQAAAAILEAAYASEMAPDDPWAYLSARQHGRVG